MTEKKRLDPLPQTTNSPRQDLLARWVMKAKSEMPIAPDELDAWLTRMESCLKLPAAQPKA